jgi:hypothetical protein
MGTVASLEQMLVEADMSVLLEQMLVEADMSVLP